MRGPVFWSALAAIVLAVTTVWAGDTGRIYGKIHTVDGDVLEGLIRWDRNEASWVDVLDGSKEREDSDRNRKESLRSERRRSTVRFFGLDLGENSDWSWANVAQSGIRFGHLRSLEVTDDDRVTAMLKSGREVELFNGSTDIGSSIREIIIEDGSQGEMELTWDDIELVEFAETPAALESSFGNRLYGTLTTRRGESFTGYVCWDMDEVFTSDVLEGDEDRRSRKIAFSKIASIERYSSSGAQVRLKSGDEVLLRNTNDVDSGNRGIVISDLGLGQVIVQWDEFETLVFEALPAGLSYRDFDGGRPLEGTVFTENGEEMKGKIRWDDDEEYTWEILDGEYRDIQFDIELGLVQKIEKTARGDCEVTLWDGRSFRLTGSNDVDEDNKGIVVTDDRDETTYLDWEEFERVEFTKP